MNCAAAVRRSSGGGLVLPGMFLVALYGGYFGTAALGLVLFGSVVWSATILLPLGLVTGAAAGPVLARRLPAEALRIGIGVAGLGLAVVLGLDAYARG